VERGARARCERRDAAPGPAPCPLQCSARVPCARDRRVRRPPVACARAPPPHASTESPPSLPPPLLPSPSSPQVVDAGDAEGDDGDNQDGDADALRRRIEAEDAQKALSATLKKKKKATAEAEEAAAAAAAAAPAPVVTAAVGDSWRARLEAKKLAEASGDWASAAGARKRDGAPPNLSSVMEFPTLPGQA
jgi:hypothetical protein